MVRSLTPLVAASWVLGGGAFQCPQAKAQVTPPQGSFTIEQTLSDGAQRTTLAFDGLAIITGNLDAQSFFPPGKVADYTGFQYLRDNDPSNMGHNTSFLTRVANNVIYTLNDSQMSQLKTLATAQLDQINLYGYQRFPLMKAFRRLLDGDLPSGSVGLNLEAVKAASRELYLVDGQISFDRALLYANIINSMDTTQKSYLDAMKGAGWSNWPAVTDDQIRSKMQGLPQGTAVAVMTYASDLFSWYEGSLEADVYFCPERHGTYYGGFYIKDAPAIGHEGYSISEQLTATAGSALCDSSQGYVTEAQAALISSLVDSQRSNLYAGATSIVQARTQIATLLRSLLTSTASSAAVQAQVLELSGTYGELDGENNYEYANVFSQVYKTLTTDQRTKLAALRESIMSGTYADGTPFDYSVCTTPFLYSSVITDLTLLDPYLSNTDYLLLGGTGWVPPAPPGVTASDGTYADRVQVTWTGLTGATGYEVWRNTTTNTATASLIGSPSSSPYADLGAIAGTRYYYWLKSKNSAGTSGFSSADGGYAKLNVPAAPTGVVASDGTYTDRVRVAWTAPVGATSYEVWRNTSNNTTTAASKGSPSNSPYDDLTAIPGTTYYYWVKSKNSAGTSSFSSVDSGYAKLTVPAAPTGVAASDGTYTDRVRVAWTAPAGATGYEVWRNTANNTTTASKISTPPGSPYDDMGALPGVTYYYWLKAGNNAGTSGFSSPDSGYAKLTVPLAPTGVAASDGAYPDRVRVAWTAPAGATSYEVWRNTSNNATTAALKGSPTSSPYDDLTAVPGTTYYYWLKSKNSAGTSGFSSADSGYAKLTVPAVPTGVAASDGTYTDRVRVTWTASTGATSYEVWRNTANNAATASKVSSPPGSPYDDMSAVSGKTYYYWVKAKNSAGTTGFSSSDSGWRK